MIETLITMFFDLYCDYFFVLLPVQSNHQPRLLYERPVFFFSVVAVSKFSPHQRCEFICGM